MRRRAFVKGFAVATAAAGTAFGQQKAAPQAQNPPPAANAVDQGTMAVQPSAASSPQAISRVERDARVRTPNIPVSQPDVVAVTEARYFTPARYAALVRLCELLMPAGDDYPSAVKAGAPEFLDFYVGASPSDHQAMYNAGLDRLNAEAKKKCNMPFEKTDAKEADAVVRPYLKGWMNDHPPTEVHVRFINLAHRDIRTATINSPAWAKAAEALGERTPNVGLYWHPIDPGIQTWVSNGMAQAAPTTKHQHA